MKYKLLYCFILLLSLSHIARGQHSIKGRVLHALTNLPLPGTSVTGSGNSTLTDSAGYFTIQAGASSMMLRFSHTGFISRQQLLQAGTGNLPVLLQPSPATLAEVTVSTGYQQLSPERITGSLQKIDNTLLNRSVSSSIIDRLEGVAGSLYFSKTSSQKEIFIRGLGTINSNTQPLIIIDNFPFEGDINSINPNDVDNIVVLRDAGAASIWGARAANGVIIITTKKVGYGQRQRISFNSNITLTPRADIYKSREYMPAADFIPLEQDLFKRGYYDASIANTVSYPVLSPVVELLAKNRAGVITADSLAASLQQLSTLDYRSQYQQYLFRPAVSQQYSLGISGGAANMNYTVNAGYDKALSNTIGDQNYRATLYAALNFKFSKQFSLGLAVNYARKENKYNGLSSVSFGGGKSQFPYPYLQIADAAGNPLIIAKDFRSGYTDTAGGGKLLSWKYSPLADRDLQDRSMTGNEAVLRINATYSFNNWLSADLKGQLQQSSNNGTYLQDVTTYSTRNLLNSFTTVSGSTVKYGIPLGGVLDKTSSTINPYSARLQLNANRQWAQHQLLAIAGAEVRHSGGESQSNRVYGYDKELLTYGLVDYVNALPRYGSLGAARIASGDAFSKTTNRFVSFFANANYTWRKKYNLSASVRKDASNLFGVNSNQKWNPFWSVGGSWSLSDEKFYRIKWLPYLRPKATYGYSGNIQSNLSALAVITYMNNTIISSPLARVLSPENPDLRWEKTGILNLGIDFGGKAKKWTGSIEWYSKNGTDLLAPVPIDPTMGIQPPVLTKNVAGINTKGLDVQFTAPLLVNKHIFWNVDVLFSKVRSRVTKYFVEADNKGTYTGDGYFITPLAGKDPYSLISYRFAGLDPLTGDPLGYIADTLSKNYTALVRPTSFADLDIKGTTRPPVFGNIRNNFSYRSLSISVNIGYYFGYYFRKSTIDYNRLFTLWRMHSDYALRWQQPGDEKITNVPSMPYPVNSNRDLFYMNSTATVLKGDHIRLQDIRLSWKTGIIKSPLFSKGELYFYCNNLGCIWMANKEKIDPMYGDAVPPAVNYSIGFKTNF